MQTDLLLKQITDRILEIKASLAEFEAGDRPNADAADRLYSELQRLAKLVGAYAFIKQQQELSPRLDLHVKVSEKIQSETIQQAVIPPTADATPKPPVQEIVEKKTEETTKPVEEPEKPEPVVEKREEAAVPTTKVEVRGMEMQVPKSNFPLISVSINDKFRFINELFKSNAVEYAIAIEQINATNAWPDAQLYLNGLRNIYGWDEESDMVKKIYELSRKRFS